MEQVHPRDGAHAGRGGGELGVEHCAPGPTGADCMLCCARPTPHESPAWIMCLHVLAQVRPLMPGVTMHAVVDACHSGTVLDLPFRTKFRRGQGFYWKGRHQ